MGFGNIGKLVAHYLHAFGSQVVVYDPYIKEPPEGVSLVSLEELLKTSDIVSIHARLCDETYHLIGEKELALMKPTAILVNTARSGLMDEAVVQISVAPSIPVQLALSPQFIRLIPGETLHYRLKGWDIYDNRMYHPTATWTVLDPLAGIIDASGFFTASLNAGVYPGVIKAESYGAVVTSTVIIRWPYQIYLPLTMK